MEPVRIAIIGCGGYAFQLVKRLWTLPEAGCLVAATSRNPDSAEARACAEKGARVFPSLDELLAFAPGEVDAILNPTPIHVHRETTLRCLEAGFPVWMEKPPVARLEELDELVAASGSAGLPVEVCFNSLYGSRLRELKRELLEGVYGPVRRIRGKAGWVRTQAYWDRAGWAGKLKSGDQWIYDGTINNPLAHLVCNNLFLASGSMDALAEASELEARLWHAGPIESEDTSSLRVVTGEGVEIVSNLTLCPEETIEPVTAVDAGKATLLLRNFENVEVLWHDGRREERPAPRENRLEMLDALCRNFREGGERPCPLAMTRPFTSLVNRAFEQVLSANGGAIPAVPAEEVEEYERDGSKARRIRGINARIERLFADGEMLDLAACPA